LEGLQHPFFKEQDAAAIFEAAIVAVTLIHRADVPANEAGHLLGGHPATEFLVNEGHWERPPVY
jgi:hypothetical protein